MGIFGISKSEANSNIEKELERYRAKISASNDERIQTFFTIAGVFSIQFIINRLQWKDSCYKHINSERARQLIHMLQASLYVFMSEHCEDYFNINEVDFARLVLLEKDNSFPTVMVNMLFIPKINENFDYFNVLSQIINEEILQNHSWNSSGMVSATKDLFLECFNEIESNMLSILLK